MLVNITIESEEIENYVRSFYQDFYKIEKKEHFNKHSVLEPIWILHAPPLITGEARYYPVSYKGLIIHNKHYRFSNNAVAIGYNAKTSSKASIAIGSTAVCKPVGIGIYKPTV